MNTLTKMLQCLPLLLIPLMFSTVILAMPRLINHHVNNNITITSSLPKEDKVLYYPQTLDHFNYQPESYAKFNQKYVINFKYWAGAISNSPILVYFGDEAPLDNTTVEALILKDYAKHFKALLLFIEHRFYGESIPFGMTIEEATKNASVRGYFNSAQAIADYAELILHLKLKLHAIYSPVIIVGGSYGGMLASWFRLKYPSIALGALASSAPVRFFDNIISPNHGYYSVVSMDFKETSKNCYDTIKKSWVEIERIAMKPNGLSILSHKFKTCRHLDNTGKLKDFLKHMYSLSAQYNIPPISTICDAINDNSKGEDILGKIYAGIVAYSGNNGTNCQDLNWEKLYSKDTIVGWGWQTCSEMVMPIVFGTSESSMFPAETFNLTKYCKICEDRYNVKPRPHWITTYYGGHDMKLIYKRFGSNIIFSNGLRDPYSIAGVLENLSDTTIALHTKNGVHTMDIIAAQEGDPKWLIHQRKREVDIIEGWIQKYYVDLKNLV